MKISLLITITLLTQFVFAQPANNNCSNAIVLTDLNGGCTTVNNTGATFDNYTLACQDYTNNMWFSFTAQGGEASIVLNGDRPELGISYAPTGDPCSISDAVGVYCGDLTGNYSTATYTTTDLIAGVTYYLQVTTNSGGSVDICITNPPAPVNDDCTSPTSITALDGSCTTGTTFSASPDSYSPSCWNTSIYDNGSTVWYSFVADGIQADINITGGAGSYPAAAIYGVVSGGSICNVGDVGQYDCAGYASGDYTSTSVHIVGYPLTPGETYYVQVTLRDDYEGNFDICIDNPINSEGDNCYSAQPFCTGSTYTFPANTNTSVVDDADFDCLGSQANPAWFYLEIATAGDIDITMTNSNNRDIDFILWGPFTDVPTGCDPGITNASSVEDCSYSTSATEVANITGAQVGETYIMLITNFSNAATDITFSQTGGTGATDCTIILPVELLTFEGQAIENNNLLSWSTSSEINNDYFHIERSTNGEYWESIGVVKGAENSTSLIEYNFSDFNFERRINYYRLKQIDFDGAFDFSDIISIDNRMESKKILKITNLLGQEIDEYYRGLVIIYYSDGTTIKKIR